MSDVSDPDHPLFEQQVGQFCSSCADIENTENSDHPYLLTNCAICNMNKCSQCMDGFHLNEFGDQYGDPVGECVEHNDDDLTGCYPASAPINEIGYYALDAGYIDSDGFLWRPWPGRTCDLTRNVEQGWVEAESNPATAIYSAHDMTHPNTGADRFVGIHVGDFTTIEECALVALSELQNDNNDYNYQSTYDPANGGDAKDWDIIAQLTFDSSFDPTDDTQSSPCYWQNTPTCAYGTTQY